VRRAFLGVRPEAGKGGVRVASVRRRSPAAAAGVLAGDTLRWVGDARVRSVDELARALAGHEPGERVAVEVMRGGRRSTHAVRLGDRPGATADR
jgi:S1-C subfamily serine protease